MMKSVCVSRPPADVAGTLDKIAVAEQFLAKLEDVRPAIGRFTDGPIEGGSAARTAKQNIDLGVFQLDSCIRSDADDPLDGVGPIADRFEPGHELRLKHLAVLFEAPHRFLQTLQIDSGHVSWGLPRHFTWRSDSRAHVELRFACLNQERCRQLAKQVGEVVAQALNFGRQNRVVEHEADVVVQHPECFAGSVSIRVDDTSSRHDVSRVAEVERERHRQ